MLECFRLGNEQSASISIGLKYQSPFADSFADNVVNVCLLFFLAALLIILIRLMSDGADS